MLGEEKSSINTYITVKSGGGWSALDMIVVNNVVNYDR